MKTAIAIWLSSALFLIAPFAAEAQVVYSYTTIDFPASTATQSATVADDGQIVGTYSNGSALQSFLRTTAGNYSTLTVPGAPETIATGINAAGTIVGLYRGNPNYLGFVRSAAGSYTTLEVPGSSNTEARGINNSGAIVGDYAEGAMFTEHGFVRNVNGAFATLDFPGAAATYAYGVNASEQIVGLYSDGANFHSFLRSPAGNYVTLNYPGSAETFGQGINDAGVIVGAYTAINGSSHGFIRSPQGAYSTLDFPGALVSSATGINNLGQIVGWYDVPNHEYGFVATPVPEPGALLLSAIGACGAVGTWISRRRRGEKSSACNPTWQSNFVEESSRHNCSALSTSVFAAALALATFAPSAIAQTYTWVGPPGSSWSSPASWNPNGVPTPTSDAFFGDTGAGQVLLTNTVPIHSLTFDSPSGLYALHTIPFNPAPTFLVGVAAITVASNVNYTQTIGLTGNANDTVFCGGTGQVALTITNNSPIAANPTLLISSNFLGTTTGNGGITVAGVGTTQISSTLNGGGNAFTGGLFKGGAGTLILSGNAANLQGVVSLAGGTLVLDYSANISNKLGIGNAGGASALVGLDLSGGTLQVKANASISVTQTVGPGTLAGTGIDTGHTDIYYTPNGSTTTALNLTGITRFVGSTLNVSSDSHFLVQTSAGLTNGILGGWATNSQFSWATVSGGNIVPLPQGSYGVNNYNPGINTDATSSTSLYGININSLRYNTPGVTTYIGNSLTLQSGGVLVSYAGSGTTINGGSLNSSTGELIVHTYGDLTFSYCSLGANNSLTKTGFGTLNLNYGAAPPSININQGDLRVTGYTALSGASSISFNDNSYGAYQSLIFQLPDGESTTVSASIRLRNTVVSDFYSQTSFDNRAQNSRITLSGAINSGIGLVTPFTVTGDASNTSGFTLTGANTFTGTLFFNHGFLGINANAALGNAANTVVLNVGSTSAGGLELLGNGIDVAHALSFFSPTRVLVYGSNTDTISGVISGFGLIKDAPGTLVLTGTNTITGGLQVNAGTLKVAAPANLGPSGSLSLAGGTLALTGSFTLPSTRPVYLGPYQGAGTAAIDVAGGQTITIAGIVSDNAGSIGALLKTGTGTLVLTNPGNSYAGGTTVQQGILQVAADGNLGAASGPVAVGPVGTLSYTGSQTTGRTFTLSDGTLSVAAGQTVTFNGAMVGGGFLRGTGAFVLTGATALSGASTLTSTIVVQTGPASVTNFSNGGTFTASAGQTLAWNGGTNSASGRLTTLGTVNASDFVSNGYLNVPAGGLINNSVSDITLGGGSTTFVGSVANPGGKIDLGGQQLFVRGGLLVTNAGSFASGNGVRNGTTVADYGALVKGTGPYQAVITQNGGQYLPGNSPGTSQVGQFFVNGGGSLIFEITDAGPSASFPSAPGTAGANPGWGLTQIFSSLEFTATPSNKFNIDMRTQLAPPASPNSPGQMSNFDPSRAYSWLVFDLQPGAVFNGTFNPNAINFITTQFANPTTGGQFSLSRTGGQVFLTFTPVPEPATILGVAFAGLVGARVIRRRRCHSARTV